MADAIKLYVLSPISRLNELQFTQTRTLSALEKPQWSLVDTCKFQQHIDAILLSIDFNGICSKAVMLLDNGSQMLQIFCSDIFKCLRSFWIPNLTSIRFQTEQEVSILKLVISSDRMHNLCLTRNLEIKLIKLSSSALFWIN